jgi:isopentenyl-diphosphate delta-isomerase
MTENVILVDEADRDIGAAEKMYAHEEGLLHRAFSVVVYRPADDGFEVLLQRRATTKYHCPGKWTNTCCSHPRPGEKLEAAAHRRLQEEMGFDSTLTNIGKFHYSVDFDNGLSENEIDHVFIGEYAGQTVALNPEETDEYQWVPLRQVSDAMDVMPAMYTPWLDGVLNLFSNHMMEALKASLDENESSPPDKQ